MLGKVTLTLTPAQSRRFILFVLTVSLAGNPLVFNTVNIAGTGRNFATVTPGSPSFSPSSSPFSSLFSLLSSLLSSADTSKGQVVPFSYTWNATQGTNVPCPG